MKKLTAMTLAVLLLVTLAVPAFAAENEFVPSIGYKDGPEVDKAEINRKDPENEDHEHETEEVTDCLVVTTVMQAQNQQTDISQDERDLLLDLYGQMTNNEITLPEDYSDWVVRDLMDVSWSFSDCVQGDHQKEEWLKEEGNTLTVTLKTGIPVGVEVSVFVFVDGNFVEVDQVTHHEGGLLTCTFEDIGLVAICVQKGADVPPAPTGDTMGRILWLWILLLIVSVGALTVLVVNRRKFMR